ERVRRLSVRLERERRSILAVEHDGSGHRVIARIDQKDGGAPALAIGEVRENCWCGRRRNRCVDDRQCGDKRFTALVVKELQRDYGNGHVRAERERSLEVQGQIPRTLIEKRRELQTRPEVVAAAAGIGAVRLCERETDRRSLRAWIGDSHTDVGSKAIAS